MQVTSAYLGHSGITARGSGARLLSLAPNLSRDRVAFDAPLADPLRFREAISALHDVVINDLRFKPRDKSAYEAWQKQQRESERTIRAAALKEAHEELAAKRGQPVPTQLKRDYERGKKTYWSARRGLDKWLKQNDKELWRALMPYDPVMTVAEDTLFFECFSADESSYGCLTVDRDTCFGAAGGVELGTTNVDYSWDLYHHFQSLRSYRETRFTIDPTGFEVATETTPSYREEKIDLPDGWLRGFMQMQSAMTLPMRKVPLSVSAVYSLLATLKRKRAKKGPRAIRFELADGTAPRLVLEPWELPIDSHGTAYAGPSDGNRPDPVRVWGRRRLLVLSRVLPLADGVDVYLLGTGLPSFWVVRMGSMRLTLGLSGWTANDWTRGSAVDMLMPPQSPTDDQVAAGAEALNRQRRASLPELTRSWGGGNQPGGAGGVAASMNQLALRGQAIFDLHDQVYRWRQVLPVALSDKEMGPPHPERAGAIALMRSGRVQVKSAEAGPRGGLILTGRVENQGCEVLIDADGMVKKGSCKCSYAFKFGVRNGPCRHLQALRDTHAAGGSAEGGGDWYARLSKWARG